MTNTARTRWMLGGSLLVIVMLVTSPLAHAAASFFRVDRVEARSTDTWTVWVTGGASRVVVDGDGDTDLDCYVYDSSGRRLGADDDTTDYCIVDVYSPTSDRLTIRIRNLGDVYNQYSLSVR